MGFSFAQFFSKGDSYQVADIYRGLRDQVLDLHKEPNSFGAGHHIAVLMETGLEDACYTLAAVADGTASLYFSNGGGILGAGQNPRGARFARALVGHAAGIEAALKPVKKFPLPQRGMTRFYLVKKGMVLSGEFNEQDLGNGRSPLSPFFHKAHELLALIRSIDESRETAGGASPADGQPNIRDTLFGDMPLENWAASQSAGSPWTEFRDAKLVLDEGRWMQAAEIFQTIAALPQLESRHYLQAWHFLRPLGTHPPAAKARHVYGVVVEVALEEGLDLLAAYEDGSARYFNFSGAGIVWDHPDDSLEPHLRVLLEAAKNAMPHLGPWEGARPPAPTRGRARLNFLTPSGLHFGEAELSPLAADPVAGPIISAATALMQELMAKSASKPR